MEHVLLVGLGPAQLLFESARSVQEAWCGLWLLDRAAAAVAQALAAFGVPVVLAGEHAGAGRLEQGRRVRVRLPDGVDPAAAGAVAKAAVGTLLTGEAQALHRWMGTILGPEAAGLVSERALHGQVLGVVDVAWAAAALAPDAIQNGRGALAAAEATADQALTSRLWSRVFGVCDGGASAADGALIHRIEPALDLDHPLLADEAVSAEVWIRLRACGFTPGERWCGVGLLQRWFAYAQTARGEGALAPPAVHSAAHVALAPVRGRVSDAMERSALDRFATRFAESLDAPLTALSSFLLLDGRFDAGLLDPARFDAHALAMGAAPITLQQRAALDRHRRRCLRDLGEFPGEPPGELALLRWQARADQPRLLGEAALRFVAEVRRSVADAWGSTLHFAADEWAALLPTHTAFECAAAMRGAWRRAQAEQAEQVELAELSESAESAGQHRDPAQPAVAAEVSQDTVTEAAQRAGGFSVVVLVVAQSVPLPRGMAMAAEVAERAQRTDWDALVAAFDPQDEGPFVCRWSWADAPLACLDEAVQLSARGVISREKAENLRALLASCGPENPFDHSGRTDAALLNAMAPRALRHPEAQAWLDLPERVAVGGLGTGIGQESMVGRLRARVALMCVADVLMRSRRAAGRAS